LWGSPITTIDPGQHGLYTVFMDQPGVAGWVLSSTIRIRVAGVILLAVGLSLLGASAAQAARIVVGSPLVGDFNKGVIFKEQGTVANTALSDPTANVTSPVPGVVVRWRMTGFSFTGPYKLRILRPLGDGKYMGAGTSSPETRVGSGTETFTTNLPIQAGDLVGLEGSSASDGFPVTENAGSSFSIWRPPLEDGLAAAPGPPDSGVELGFDAVVQPAPQVVLMSPTSGPVTGGTSVTISGHDFTEVTAVRFGSTPATSFSVQSESSITAASPPSAQAGKVDVTVVAAGGTSPVTAGDQFTYASGTNGGPPLKCVVPNLRGETLKAARKRARKASCKIGPVKTVKGAARKAGKIVKQKPKPGKVRAAGTKIAITLG
jgi:IPT/TIG domain/PASTA domain